MRLTGLTSSTAFATSVLLSDDHSAPLSEGNVRCADTLDSEAPSTHGGRDAAHEAARLTDVNYSISFIFSHELSLYLYIQSYICVYDDKVYFYPSCFY